MFTQIGTPVYSEQGAGLRAQGLRGYPTAGGRGPSAPGCRAVDDGIASRSQPRPAPSPASLLSSQ